MALVFPRDLPGCGARTVLLELADNVAMSASAGGRVINRSQVNDPVWRCSVETYTLRAPGRAEWGAWKNSLLGGLRSFLVVDSRRRWPLAYPDARAPAQISAGWAGTASVTALGAGGMLTLAGLPAGYKLTAGDRIGLEQGTPLRRGYYEVMESVTASGAGVVAVPVAPFLHATIFTTAAVARLWQPRCECVIDWQSWRDQTGGVPSMGTMNFEAWQKL